MTQFKKFYDLSQPVYDHCPGWPTYEPTVVRYEATYEKDRFNAEQIRLNSHTGTHLDAPSISFLMERPLISWTFPSFKGMQ